MAHLDLAKAGMISAGCAFVGEGLQIVFGSLSDKGYRKLLLILGLITTAASTLLAYTHSYPFIFGLFLLTCLGLGAFHPAAVSMMSEFTLAKDC